MECLEDDGVSCLEDDLDLSEDEISTAKDHWPELPVVNNHPMLITQHGNQQSTSSSSNKRRADYSITEECQLPAAKTAKCASAKYVEPAPQPSVFLWCIAFSPLQAHASTSSVCPERQLCQAQLRWKPVNRHEAALAVCCSQGVPTPAWSGRGQDGCRHLPICLHLETALGHPRDGTDA